MPAINPLTSTYRAEWMEWLDREPNPATEIYCKFQECWSYQQTTLDLSGYGLKSLPAFVVNSMPPYITELILHHNDLRERPAGLERLSLLVIDLRDNPRMRAP